jgi:hypothetical protein
MDSVELGTNAEALLASTKALLEALETEAAANRELNRHPTAESTRRLIEARQRVDESGGAYLQSLPVARESS